MKLEGKNAIFEALNSNLSLQKILILNTNKDEFTKSIIDLARSKNIAVNFVSKQVLDSESETGHHQGFIGLASDFKYSEVSDILNKANSLEEDLFVVILDGVEDPHNLGSIIRTCECAGVHGIIIPKNNACPVNETVVRSSAGSISHILIARVTNINNVIKDLKADGIFVYGMEAEGELIYKANLKGKIALVVGSEGFGIGTLTKNLCDQIVSLPMEGKTNSLNASVATALGVYEALRQRKF
ncbi:MAG: 23S rRNA (guanosine(2251)-2'-O)-methyltransferase RlmB [Spirochaetales bacterium]